MLVTSGMTDNSVLKGFLLNQPYILQGILFFCCHLSSWSFECCISAIIYVIQQPEYMTFFFFFNLTLCEWHYDNVFQNMLFFSQCFFTENWKNVHVGIYLLKTTKSVCVCGHCPCFLGTSTAIPLISNFNTFFSPAKSLLYSVAPQHMYILQRISKLYIEITTHYYMV